MTELLNFILISVFLSFPESILILLLGLSLCNIKIRIEKVILISALQAVVALIVRYVNFDFGIHTIVQLGTTCIFLSVIMNIKLYKAIVPVLIGVFIEGILAFIIVSGIDTIYAVDFSLLNVKFIHTFAFALPVKIAELILVLIIRKTEFTMCNIEHYYG